MLTISQTSAECLRCRSAVFARRRGLSAPLPGLRVVNAASRCPLRHCRQFHTYLMVNSLHRLCSMGTPLSMQPLSLSEQRGGEGTHAGMASCPQPVVVPSDASMPALGESSNGVRSSRVSHQHGNDHSSPIAHGLKGFVSNCFTGSTAGLLVVAGCPD